MRTLILIVFLTGALALTLWGFLSDTLHDRLRAACARSWRWLNKPSDPDRRCVVCPPTCRSCREDAREDESYVATCNELAEQEGRAEALKRHPVSRPSNVTGLEDARRRLRHEMSDAEIMRLFEEIRDDFEASERDG